ncbi:MULTISPECIES: gas vesicle protein GvpA [unclassified Halorubrum]|uniref:gas vesicle protein GvpA n=1 Tax=unclassified Halorubrum TaxID=2642239 RepID=UPI000B997DEB|nr:MULTISPECIES: gas vesicle structural protein GvpA [unclassified Halorubrum]OYR39568.1 gas vesicle protein GvpA [Halorubrum sp. Hd13]OYR40996.1 gas vesicle protein GvpA [Halorubrum sp. Eb13]OYR49708.1 gas vesicle protein GvpA [Halorubrum sp. Ea8]OYR51591.1 gas vesicle protein GvpA [Halorubrum sp. Ea1]
MPASASPDSSSLAEVLDRILDKGIVIDVWARISVVGIEILTIEARVVAASIDTFLTYASEMSKIEQATQTGDLDDIRDLEIETTSAREHEQAMEKRRAGVDAS